jgi:hypothetical protein
MTQTTSPNIYSAADIEANRAGRLTDNQRRDLKGQARSFSRGMLFAALFAVVIGALLAISNGPAPNAWARPAASAAFFLGALVCLFLALRPNPEAADASDGRVDAVDGPIGKTHYTTHGKNSSITSYYLEVGEKRYEVGSAEYSAAPDAGWVRVYVTPRTHIVVNLEQLPDRVVPNMATLAPTAILGQVASAIFSPDQETRNEKRAEMEAMGHALKAQMDVSDVPAKPPSAADRDPRPLAQAILGKWQMGPMSMTFMPDGTMVATFMGGHQKQGRWSIGADGKLRADAAGNGGAADAWIAGDTLTISQKSGAAAFHRAN